MINQWMFLVVGCPLFTSLITGIFGGYFPSIVRVVSSIGLLLGFGSAILLFNQVIETGHMSYYMGNWPPKKGLNCPKIFTNMADFFVLTGERNLKQTSRISRGGAQPEP